MIINEFYLCFSDEMIIFLRRAIDG